MAVIALLYFIFPFVTIQITIANVRVEADAPPLPVGKGHSDHVGGGTTCLQTCAKGHEDVARPRILIAV